MPKIYACMFYLSIYSVRSSGAFTVTYCRQCSAGYKHLLLKSCRSFRNVLHKSIFYVFIHLKGFPDIATSVAFVNVDISLLSFLWLVVASVLCL